MGQAPVKRSRFIQLPGGTRKVNRQPEEKARAIAGVKGAETWTARTSPCQFESLTWPAALTKGQPLLY